MVTNLYLIRHGETKGAEVRRYKGSIDVPLSEKGIEIEQMKRVATFIETAMQDTRYTIHDKKNHESCIMHRASPILSAVYCSDLSRAIKSAEIIAKPHGIKPIVIPELRERNFGVWEGMSFDEIKEKYPEEFDAWANNPLKHSPRGGESTIEVRDRVLRALKKVMSDERQETSTDNAPSNPPLKIRGGRGSYDSESSLSNIAIVAHGGVNRVILCHFLGIPLENIFRIEQDYGCVNIIELWDKYPVVKLINYAGQK
ncbi:MAG: histidine phosphatase family protein [Nitrospirae bacterium]|nr:histidine phosphatase family protein [Nitrospirota bacterium]